MEYSETVSFFFNKFKRWTFFSYHFRDQDWNWFDMDERPIEFQYDWVSKMKKKRSLDFSFQFLKPQRIALGKMEEILYVVGRPDCTNLPKLF